MRMADYLSKAPAWSVTLNTAYDTVQPNGYKVEWNEMHAVTLRRPDCLRIEGERMEVRAAAVPGSLNVDLGDLNANKVVGPVRLVTRSRDVHIADFTDSLELESARGDIEITSLLDLLDDQDEPMQSLFAKALNLYVSPGADATPERVKEDSLKQAIEDSLKQ